MTTDLLPPTRKLPLNMNVPLPERFQSPFADMVRSQERGNKVIKSLIDEAAMETSLELLRPLAPAVQVERMSQTHPGYDILVNGRVRVQVKGSSYLDWVSGMFGNFDFDIALIVDVACPIRQRHIYSDRAKYPYNECVQFYVFPRAVVEANAYRKSMKYGLYALKNRKLNEAKTAKLRFDRFHDYHAAFEHLTNAISVTSRGRSARLPN